MSEQFSLGEKWFWAVLGASVFSAMAGLIFGVSLLAEKSHRKEGMIIVVFAVACYLIKSLWLYPWLMSSGFVPYRIIKA